MRILKWGLGGIAVLIVVLVAVGMLLPRQVTVARSIEIDAPAAAIFPYINSLKAMGDWSPWLERDPNVQVSFNEIEAGEGAKMQWQSEQRDVGSGQQEITESKLNEAVVTALDFGEMGVAEAKLTLTEAEGQTEVTWTLDTDMGAGPVGRWFGLMMDGMVGPDYEKGLANLKALVES